MHDDDMKSLLASSDPLKKAPVDAVRLSLLESKIVFAAMAQKQSSPTGASFSWSLGHSFPIIHLATAACFLFLIGLAAGQSVLIRSAAKTVSVEPSLMTMAMVSPWQSLE